jgi:uncharacterized protein YjiS (DUF1127 family)
LAGFDLRALRPGSDVTRPQQSCPAVRVAGARAATDCAELLHTPASLPQKHAAHPWANLGHLPARLVRHVIAWYRNRGAQRILARLNDRELRDIGIDRATINRDSTPAFWRFR